MKIPLSTSRAVLLALAGPIVSALPLAAAPVPNPVNGQVFLGFRASGGQGGDTSYLVNLGLGNPFVNAADGTTYTLDSIGDIGADLAATYGSDWSTREDLHWGIFGVINGASPAVFGSRERPSSSTQSTPWPALNLTSRNSVSTQVLSVLEGIDGYRGREATANSPVATLQPNASGASSYNFQVATAGTTDFGSLSQWSSIEGSFSGGTAAAALDLYRLSGSADAPVRYAGRFTISPDGVVTFSKPAPTPSNLDSDGDGWTDEQEELAGTDPHDPSDFFRVEELSHGSGGTTIGFRPAADRIYRIEYSENLLPDSWQVIQTLPAGATPPPILEFLDTDPERTGQGRGFYRVEVTR